ncbi:MAG: TOBE domain-containing protein [Thermodesulfovibrionales bacterium]|nr:TOBE domain-containing protein [Thermodesulfovibrionales bacterium]
MFRDKKQGTQSSMTERTSHACIVSMPNESHCLDTVQMNRLEQSFRSWADGAPRADVHLSRRRILLIFLLIRYTGGKLNEVLALNPFQDVDFKHHLVFLGGKEKKKGRPVREVRIPEALSEEIKSSLDNPAFKNYLGSFFKVDPGHVRRKFYERAIDSGIPPSMGAPESIRRSRAIELMQSNMPLPVVQKILGHSTLNMTASYVDFSDADMRQVAKHFIEKESHRKTSARNSFFGKISSIKKGDIQAKVEMITMSGDIVTTIITNDSLSRLGLKTGYLITAEVKAPWVILQKNDREPESSAENRFIGTITRINKGKLTTEYVVRISDGTELCSIVTTENTRLTGFKKNDRVWAIFNSFAVVLHID